MTSPDRQEHPDDRLGGLVRRVLSPGPSPEERLEELLAQRRLELDEHAARLTASLAELERREELLRDSRASVERMLRLGTADLEAREAELTDFLRDLSEREKRLSEAEAGLARRRQELGAVELKRAALERRELAVAAREERMAEHEARLAEADSARAAEQHSALAELAFVPGPEYRLLEVGIPDAERGRAIEIEGREYLIVRTGPSPLPGDARRCAYLVRGLRGLSPSGGSS